jgi:sialate O-acetylesterase
MHARIARSEVRVPAVFTDHMVLQREMKLPIWGWADPGETVSVSFLNQHKSVIADSAGRWRVLLDPVPASATPEVLTIAGRNTVSVSDVLVGDVWICSGQSNMQLRLKASSNASVDVPAANRPLIHLLQVEHIARAEEQDDIRGQWTACSPKTAADFSAVGYYFGRDLQDVIKVPVGLIHSSWAGSIAEVWTPPESLQGNPILAPILSRYQDAIRVLGPKMEKYRQAYAIWASKAFPQDPGNTGLTDGWASQDYNDSGWTSTDVPVEWSEVPGINVVGMVWFRGTIDVPTEMAGRDLILSLGSIAHCDMTYFNGQQVGSTWVDVPDARQVQRRYKVPGSMVHVGKNVIAIRAFNITGIGAISGPAAEMYIAPENDSATRHRLPVAGKWKCKLEHKLEQNNNPPPKPERPLGPDNPTAPSNLFNGMIKPIIPFAIKGVIWYQGEGNGGRGYQYRTLLPALIQGWRARWHEGDFPFLIVQLPNFSNPSSQPVTNEPWPALREAQLFTVRSVPATGLAVTIDIGERQVHPGNKKDVGHRLALAALDVAYHLNGPSTGPLYLSCRADGDHISITFDHIGSGLTMRKGMNSLAGFAIAGFDRKFVAADARIVGDTVVVRSAAIPSPAAVRYLWANNPSASLFNLDGLPASPFRTDDWPIATQDAR